MRGERKPLDSILVKPAGPDCNMGCTYCFYLKKAELFEKIPAHRMNEEVLDATVRRLMAEGGRRVSFGWQGGEPTLMGLPFFEKAVELQKKYGRGQEVGNGLQTNGLLVGGDWARFLAKYRFLVGLSLDGPEHIHDRYRRSRGGGGTFARVRDKAKLLLDAGAAVNALSVVNDYSVRFPEEIYSFHKELGLTFMQFIPAVEKDPADPDRPAPFSVPPEEYGAFLRRLFDLWLADFEEGVPKTSIRFFDSLFYRYVGLEPPECTLLEECGVYVVVEHNGDVYSCDFFVDPRWRLGNVLEDTLVDMLNSPRQRAFGRIKAGLPAECRGCPWLDFCRGGCPKDRALGPAEETRSAFDERRVPAGTVHSGGSSGSAAAAGPKGRERAAAAPVRLNYLCPAFKAFFEHAHEAMKDLAAKWAREQELAAETEEEMLAAAPREREPYSSGLPSEGGGLPGARTPKKIGRNDPCPCGSGRKYKKCCGKGL